MLDRFTKENFHRFNALFSERMRWASLSVSIEEITRENTSLVRNLAKYDPLTTVSLLASLLTLPEYQSHCIRFEILVALAVMHCRGRKKASKNAAIRWFVQIGRSNCIASEDAAEDVFVSLVSDNTRDFRLIEGVWEGAGFYTQLILDIVGTMPDTGQFEQIKKSVRALLVISDMVCDKAGLVRYQLGSVLFHSKISPHTLPFSETLISRVVISLANLNEYGITLHDITPFIFLPQMRKALSAQQIGLSHLDRCPLIVYDDKHLTVALPSAISVAIRDYVIAHILESELTETFDSVLAQNYSKLLFDTPLLGGPLRTPVHWMKTGSHRWSNFCLRIDEGYFVSFHLFLPSVQIHPDGGFKAMYSDEGALSKILQASINEVVKHFEGQANFKEGLVVVVGCGWGKGYAYEVLELNHSHWRLESMSAADLVRLSWLEDMNPSYFWRIHDGLDAIGKAGVKIVNPNGFLNLIGWIRQNDGHFVPHAQLPDGEISKERPLMLYPPHNLLREVRADSDRGLDRHWVVDNAGSWHKVQHVSPVLFNSESALQVYASMDDVQDGRLTSVYEGEHKLWLSITTPDILEKETQYRLWEMANEWLARIGYILDGRGKTVGKLYNLKVYVEIHGDIQSGEWGSKPAIEDLLPLCAVEPHGEPNACKANFQSGFLAGFRSPENIAERLFVRTLVGAYLNLLGMENSDSEAEAITALVVPNDDARSFHIYHAQRFLDYVKDTLPKKLIAADPIDDAAFKIGLGWSVLKKGQSNKLEGIEACTHFLGNVVDFLLVETIEALKSFNRLAILSRLVANCEKADMEREHWKRTSAAIIGLHGNEPNTIDRYVEQMSIYAGANIASRILIEIALCVCPADGGKQVSNIELGKLISRAGLVINFGNLSDAIYYKALVPELKISPLGDILFQDEFGHLIVGPLLAQQIGDDFIDNAPLQKRIYEEPRVVPVAKEDVSDEFWQVWKTEMGFDLDEARHIIDALENEGIKNTSAILKIRKSIYMSLAYSARVPEDSAIRFLDQFTLSARPHWDKPPEGFGPKDIYPWRFGRRLSYLSRPILRVYDGDDPLLIIAPGALRNGFAYVVGGSYHGRLDRAFFSTKEMKDVWLGKAREGYTFNAAVARTLSEAGWQVRENIGLPELLNRKLDRDFGDVDVLAWHSDRNEVLIIECKDLALARNYSEIAALLSDYQGVQSDGKADKLLKHLNRVAVLQNNGESIKRFTGISEPRLVSWLVCRGVVPMQYAKIDALAGTNVGGVKDIFETLV
jgi:hypothetical protein